VVKALQIIEHRGEHGLDRASAESRLEVVGEQHHQRTDHGHHLGEHRRHVGFEETGHVAHHLDPRRHDARAMAAAVLIAAPEWQAEIVKRKQRIGGGLSTQGANDPFLHAVTLL